MVRPSAATASAPREKLADALAAFVDVLLPGDGTWPAGSVVGAQHPLLMRFLDVHGEARLPPLAGALERIGAPFEGMDADGAVAAVSVFERDDPALFGWLRDAAYFAYYEAPAVVALINARGTPYKVRPHVSGYDLPKFDPATQTPVHGRGSWIATDAVKGVDTSGLDLEGKITANWGLQR